jgi:hypothetical protein
MCLEGIKHFYIMFHIYDSWKINLVAYNIYWSAMNL